MRGDFTRWSLDDPLNWNGVLHQQGRVLLDTDISDQARLAVRWQDAAARAAFGRDQAAVPESEPDGFRVTRAEVVGGEVRLELGAGQVWADGTLAHLRLDTVVPASGDRGATHLGPPVQPFPVDVGAAGTRDAVVLEVWREALNGFQVPSRLIEPALGGPDTAERLVTAFAFRLARLNPGETCDELAGRIQDDLAARGRLSVTLQPTTSTGGDCPTAEQGGYTGFEHHLYRVEIARTNGGAGPMFKWSRFNGGLVGRGQFRAAPDQVTLLANREAILRADLAGQFYIEALEPRPDRGEPSLSAGLAEYWEVVYGARATLNGDGQIELGAVLFGSIPTSDPPRFFIVWDGIRPVADFPSPAAPAEPNELIDGIRLTFDAPSGANYQAGDFWTFAVRAGGLGNPGTLVDDAPPEGPLRARVLLAELSWTGAGPITADAGQIQDCRRPFPPLTEPCGCCLAVRPGNDLARAVARLIETGGGCLCLLPGDHILQAPLDLRGAANLQIVGFGLASRLRFIAREAQATFLLDLAQDIHFEDFAVFSRARGPIWSCRGTRGLTLEGMFAYAPLSNGVQPLIALSGSACRDWRVERSILVGPAGLAGARLSGGALRANRFFGVLSGVHLDDLQDVAFERNAFIGLPPEAVRTLDGAIAELLSEPDGRTSLPRLLDRLLAGLASGSQGTSRSYVALRTSGAFELRFNSNSVAGRIGLYAEVVMDATVRANVFRTALFGASLGLVHGLRFEGNRIGEAAGSVGDATARTGALRGPLIGLQLLSDAIDCEIADNRFRGVETAILFDDDPGGEKEIVNDFAVGVLSGQADLSGTENAGAYLVQTRAFVTDRRASHRLVQSPFFRLGRCERTSIRGNAIEARRTGIAWLGTKNIVDFRISRNAFAGCELAAILIEPDDRVFVVAEPVDTKVRLIDSNRFDVESVAIRATIGAVRVERNDIRVRPPRAASTGLGPVLGLLADEVYTAPELHRAVEESDIYTARRMTAEVTTTARRNPQAVNSARFVKRAREEVLAPAGESRRDVLTDNVRMMAVLAAIGDSPLVVAAANDLVIGAVARLEGHVVSLGGIQNRCIDNRLLSDNPSLGGGVVFHFLSGEARGNEIHAARIGLTMLAKAGQSPSEVRVEGNVLRVTGPPAGTGNTPPAYALAIPVLGPGSLAIVDNQFRGSVMVGAEPFASIGLIRGRRLPGARSLTLASAVAFDANSLVFALANPQVTTGPSAPDPTLVNVVNGLALVNIVRALWDPDPHARRAVVQFSNNRVIRGWAAIARSTGGAFWSLEDLRRNDAEAPLIGMSGNVFDYWARVVGRDVILTGNHSQYPIQYRAGRRVEQAANLPAATPF
jgi:hypothetical protein